MSCLIMFIITTICPGRVREDSKSQTAKLAMKQFVLVCSFLDIIIAPKTKQFPTTPNTATIHKHTTAMERCNFEYSEMTDIILPLDTSLLLAILNSITLLMKQFINNIHKRLLNIEQSLTALSEMNVQLTV